MDAFAAHSTMSKQALDSERVRGGIKDVLLGPAQLYEALRAKGDAVYAAIWMMTWGSCIAANASGGQRRPCPCGRRCLRLECENMPRSRVRVLVDCPIPRFVSLL
jgi:hypothetical protein